MVRKVIVAVILATGTPAWGQAPLPAFEFKEYKAGVDLSGAKLSDCSRQKPNGVQECMALSEKVAGLWAEFLSAKLYQGRLSMLTVGFRPRDFDTIVEALRAKFGEPCSTATDELQTRMGVKASNLTITWCFHTGKLTALQYAGRLDQSAFTYLDDWQPPKEAPKVDF